MSGLETAIRNALERSERASPEVRARIYQSARNALEAGLRKQQINDPEAIAAQRHRLEAAIHQIEAEERTTVAPVVSVGEVQPLRREPAPSVAAVEPAAGTRRPVETGHFGDMRPDRGDGFSAGATVEPGDTHPAASTDFRPERVAKARKRRGRLFSFLLVAATLIAAFGTTAWWLKTSGLLDPAPGAASGGGATVSGQSFSGDDPLRKSLDTQNRFSADWRQVFTPADTGALSAGSSGRVESVGTNDGPTARITSTAPERDGAIRIPVSPEILREMAGKTSTVALSLQATGDKPVQVSVECAFSSMGGCGRHRFTVSEKTDVLFQVEFEGSLTPNEAGHLLLNSDIAGGGASVNLYAVRILPGA